MKERLDVMLVKRNLAESREKAKAVIMSGNVFVDGQREDKAGASFPPDVSIEVRGHTLPYVSRGGLKLEKALANFDVDVRDKVCTDVGSSTGGFTDCMLQNGARKVFAIDVGRGQLDWKLRQDERVVCMEKTNIRYVTPEDLGEPIDFSSIDVSFISLTKVLEPIRNYLREDGEIVALIKPQFEAGREKVGKKGVVREKSTHHEVIEKVADYAVSIGFRVLAIDFSPIRGPEGNIEYLIHLKKCPPGEAGAEGTNKLKDPDYAVTNQILNYIEENGRKAVLSQKDEAGHIVPGTVPEEADCALVLGGDGTLIRAVRDMGGCAMPLLGINLGTLGYLTDVELKEFRPALDRLFRGDFDIEERMMLEGTTADGRRDLAVNDIVLAREGKIRIVQFNLYVNGTLLNTYLADGVILSTPTGSTGYNLSAGGPVVEPTASMIVITPICSHALNTSSVVLSSDDVIEVEICEGRYGRTEQVAVCYDGAEQTTLVTGDRVVIRRAQETTRLVKLSRESFMKTMRRKMKGN